MPKCNYCDNNLSPSAKVCPKCGDELNDSNATNFAIGIMGLLFFLLMSYAAYYNFVRSDGLEKWFFSTIFSVIALFSLLGALGGFMPKNNSDN